MLFLIESDMKKWWKESIGDAIMIVTFIIKENTFFAFILSFPYMSLINCSISFRCWFRFFNLLSLLGSVAWYVAINKLCIKFSLNVLFDKKRYSWEQTLMQIILLWFSVNSYVIPFPVLMISFPALLRCFICLKHCFWAFIIPSPR